jgi:hypothetical protein
MAAFSISYSVRPLTGGPTTAFVLHRHSRWSYPGEELRLPLPEGSVPARHVSLDLHPAAVALFGIDERQPHRRQSRERSSDNDDCNCDGFEQVGHGDLQINRLAMSVQDVHP